MTNRINAWTAELAAGLRIALEDFRPQALGEIAIFAIDCHPWNGTLVLAALTSDEVANDPALANVAEMASWKFYNFGAKLFSWQQIVPGLCKEMKEMYTHSPADVERYFVAVAQAVGAPEVAHSLRAFNLAKGFRVSVTHPDTNKEYVPAIP